jgi:hypothetical protein
MYEVKTGRMYPRGVFISYSIFLFRTLGQFLTSGWKKIAKFVISYWSHVKHIVISKERNSSGFHPTD